MSDTNLTRQVKNLIKKGVYDPDELFRRIYLTNRAHYSKVREAVHHVKSF